MDFVSIQDKISFFEMAPMNELSNFLRQAMNYLLNIATSHYERLVWLRYYSQDVVFSLESLITLWYLVRKQATYAEVFYGFKRSVKTSTGIRPLRKLDIFFSLFFETILPYLKIKIEKYLESKVQTSRKHRILAKIVFLVSKMCQIIKFAYYFRYLIDSNFQFFKPYYHFFGFIIRRQNTFEKGQDMKKPLLWRMFS